MDGFERLKALSQRMKREVESGTAPNPEQLTVRQFMSWFGYGRRGSHIVARIRQALEELDLRTAPDFDRAWFGERISIRLDTDTVEGAPGPEEPADPTIRIGQIDAANRRPVAIGPDAELIAATTLMHANDFSQLPVMQGDRQVKGIITWESIGTRLSLGRECRYVRDCMDRDVPEIGRDGPLFSAIGVMQQHGYVLVRGSDGTIAGIVTSSDVTEQFVKLARPFLVIGEIEGYLRTMIRGKLSSDEIGRAVPGPDAGGRPPGPDDLTLGGLCQLLGNREHWDRLGLQLDRREFGRVINWVRERRNDVMHFDPEGLEPEAVDRLESIAKFFRSLRRMEVV